MLQLDATTISTAGDITLGIDKFKIIESPGKIIFYDAERDDGFSISGDFDNNVIKNDMLEHFQDEYERKGALGLTADDISEYIWNNRTENDGIHRLEGAYLNIPGKKEDIWIKNYDEKYASGLDETLTHSFEGTVVKFGIKYPLSEENPETAIIFRREPDGSRLGVNIKGDIDTAKMLVENTVKHFDKEQGLPDVNMSMIIVHNYLKSKFMEWNAEPVRQPEDIWMKSSDIDVTVGERFDKDLYHSFGDMQVKFQIRHPRDEEGHPAAIACSFGDTNGIVTYAKTTELAEQLVQGTINHFQNIHDGIDNAADFSISDIGDYLDSKAEEIERAEKQEDVWIKNNDKTISLEPDETLTHTFGNNTIKFGIMYPLHTNSETILICSREKESLYNFGDQFDVKGDVNTVKTLVHNALNFFDKIQNTSITPVEDVRNYLTSQTMKLKQEAEIKNPQDLTVQLAKKAGYVQGVCECVAAIGDDYTLGKKLLSEMNVTKDMAKKFANPETYKAMEQGIFAPQQKIEQTHSIKR